MCERAVDVCSHALEYVSDQYKTKEMCEIAVQKDPYASDFVPDQYKILEV